LGGDEGLKENSEGKKGAHERTEVPVKKGSRKV